MKLEDFKIGTKYERLIDGEWLPFIIINYEGRYPFYSNMDFINKYFIGHENEFRFENK